MEFNYEIPKEEKVMKVMKEKLSKLMYLLGWHPDGKPTKVSYITFLISLCMIGSLDCILEISVKKIITLCI